MTLYQNSNKNCERRDRMDEKGYNRGLF